MTSSKTKAMLAMLVAACLVTLMAAPAMATTASGRTREHVAHRGSLAPAAALTPSVVPGFDPTPNDQWDPADDTISGARPLPTAWEPHNLVYDSFLRPDFYDYDFFEATLTAGHTYRVQAEQYYVSYGSADPMIDVFKSSDITAGVMTELPGTDKYIAPWPSRLEVDNASYEATASGTSDGSSNIYYTPTVTARYCIVVSEGWNSLGGGSYRIKSTDLGVIAPGKVSRVYALSNLAVYDRYAVAAALAEVVGASKGVTQPANVIIASGLDKAAADPLAAGPLAGMYNAPILLVRADSPYALPTATRAYLLRLKAAKARPITFTIVGGPASVPDSLKAYLLAAAPVGSKIGARYTGIDRYAVAAAVAAKVRYSTASNEMCFVTNGATPAYFFDTLAVSALAAQRRIPILLTRPTLVPAATALEAARYKKRVVVGTPSVITPSTYFALHGTERIGYTDNELPFYDRQYMARLVAEYAIKRGWMDGTKMGVTNKLADALVGGSAMGRLGGFVLFADAAYMDPEWTEGLVVQERPKSPSLYVIGGSASVGPWVFGRLQRILY